MALKDWENRHTAFNKDHSMKKVKVKILLNIGTQEQWVEPYQAGETPDVDEDVAHRLYRLGWAEEYDAKKEAEREEDAMEAAVQAAMPAAAAKVAAEEAQHEAEARLKNPKSARAALVKENVSPVSAETPKEFASDTHHPKKATG